MDETQTEPAVVVKELYKTFKLPHEQHSGLKQSLLGIFDGAKGYELQRVLKNINFEVKKGDFFSIVGRNGSGKSTLLKLLAGIYVPDSGLVQVNGNLTPFIELGVGFNPELTGRENVFLNGALLGFSRQEMEEIYDEIVAFAELKKFMDQKLKNYSSGMQVRLAFSIAIRSKGDILLIDEVLAVGDAAFQQKCYDYFEKIKEDKKTIILVTHDMSAVNRFCNRALYLRNGKIERIGTPDEIADLYMLENLERANIKDQPDVEVSEKATIKLTKVKQSGNELVLKLTYKNEEKDDMYVGMSLILNGVSVGEITTPLDLELMGSGSVTYTLDTSQLNANAYQISAILCRKADRHLIAVGDKRVSFAVEGKKDLTHGAAIKLDHNWQTD
jgi:ABC-2 type transport system ATP-binding protein